MKYAFCFSGGGALGAFSVGAAYEFYRAGYIPEHCYGTSAGALTAAGFASISAKPTLDLWLGIRDIGDVFSPAWWKGPFARGWYSTAPLRKLVDKHLWRENFCAATVGTVHYPTGKLHYVRQKSVSRAAFLDAVVGSCCQPVIMELVNGIWADGGLREQTPVTPALAGNFDKIFCFMTNPIGDRPLSSWAEKFPPLASIGTRALEIMTDEIYQSDLRDRMAKNADRLVLVAPDKLMLGPFDFDHKSLAAGIEQGRETALRVLKNLGTMGGA